MIARDKLLHVAMGVLCAGAMVVALWLFAAFGLGPALAFATTAFGFAYEAQQWYRGEGAVELADALCTAAPGWLAWIVLEVAL